MQERRVRKKSNARDFYTSTFKPDYIQLVKATRA